MPGLHDCDLRPTPPPDARPWYEPLPGHLRAASGTGGGSVSPVPRHRLRRPGTVFAAPALIGHHVADHGHLPPRPFVDAVRAFAPYGSWQAKYAGIRFPRVPDDALLRHVDDA
ncbi:hypothetical protein ACFVY9_12230 [Streptomyces sp. NPDC059544]|uniref:DUF7919 family protein n=1 Tax=Streptomyces sp. NPDC059544 TaxID=3346861 RepID=UPI00369AC257